MIEQIKNWLKNPEYSAGLLLAEKYLKNAVLIRNLRRGPNRMNRQLMVQSLKNLIPITQRIRIIIPNHQPKPTADSNPGDSIPGEIGNKLEILAKEKSTLFHARAKLSNSLHNFRPNDNEGRQEVVDQINDLSKQMNEIRKQEESIASGQAEAPEPIKRILSPSDLLKLRNNLRTRISKTKKQVETFTASGDENKVNKYQLKLQSLQSELEQIEKQV